MASMPWSASAVCHGGDMASVVAAPFVSRMTPAPELPTPTLSHRDIASGRHRKVGARDGWTRQTAWDAAARAVHRDASRLLRTRQRANTSRQGRAGSEL